MNDPGIVKIILEQLEAQTDECKFFESFDDKRSPLFCQGCNGRDYTCEFYTPRPEQLYSLDPKE